MPTTSGHHVPKSEIPSLEHVVDIFDGVPAKEISKLVFKMGQRELQAKFNAVYNTVTRSNNNDWLRRKLLEGGLSSSAKILASCSVVSSSLQAIGVKASSKCKATPKKPHREHTVRSGRIVKPSPRPSTTWPDSPLSASHAPQMSSTSWSQQVPLTHLTTPGDAFETIFAEAPPPVMCVPAAPKAMHFTRIASTASVSTSDGNNVLNYRPMMPGNYPVDAIAPVAGQYPSAHIFGSSPHFYPCPQLPVHPPASPFAAPHAAPPAHFAPQPGMYPASYSTPSLNYASGYAPNTGPPPAPQLEVHQLPVAEPPPESGYPNVGVEVPTATPSPLPFAAPKHGPRGGKVSAAGPPPVAIAGAVARVPSPHLRPSDAACTDAVGGVERGNHSDGDTDSELLFTSRSDLMPEALLVQEDLAEGEAGGRDSVDSGFSGGLLDDAIDGIWDGSATGVVEDRLQGALHSMVRIHCRMMEWSRALDESSHVVV